MRGLGERLLLGKFSFIMGRDQQYKDATSAVHAYIDCHFKKVLSNQADQKSEKFTAPNESDPPKERYILNEMAKETHDPMELGYSLLNVFFFQLMVLLLFQSKTYCSILFRNLKSRRSSEQIFWRQPSHNISALSFSKP